MFPKNSLESNTSSLTPRVIVKTNKHHSTNNWFFYCFILNIKFIWIYFLNLINIRHVCLHFRIFNFLYNLKWFIFVLCIYWPINKTQIESDSINIFCTLIVLICEWNKTNALNNCRVLIYFCIKLNIYDKTYNTFINCHL